MKIISVFAVLILALFITGCATGDATEKVYYGAKYTGSGHDPAKDAISIEDLKTHNQLSDCWVAYGNSVYDITEYVQSNTGLQGSCGDAGFEVVVDSKNINFTDIESVSEYKGDLDA